MSRTLANPIRAKSRPLQCPPSYVDSWVEQHSGFIFAQNKTPMGGNNWVSVRPQERVTPRPNQLDYKRPRTKQPRVRPAMEGRVIRALGFYDRREQRLDYFIINGSHQAAKWRAEPWPTSRPIPGKWDFRQTQGSRWGCGFRCPMSPVYRTHLPGKNLSKVTPVSGKNNVTINDEPSIRIFQIHFGGCACDNTSVGDSAATVETGCMDEWFCGGRAEKLCLPSTGKPEALACRMAWRNLLC